MSYALGYTDRELERLTAQHRMFGAWTRAMFEEAGVRPGMKVLELGTGAGDVAMLAAAMVGPTGKVTGVERGDAALATARARIAAAGFGNVTVHQGDVAEFVPAEPVDVICGRTILLYLADPAATLRRLMEHLRPGGIVAFHEFDLAAMKSVPEAPAFEQAADWMCRAFTAAKVDLEMGPRLNKVMVEAGLPAPAMAARAEVGAEDHPVVFTMVAEVIRSLLPLIERARIATAAEVDVDTLAERMRADVARVNGVAISPLNVTAWSRTAG